MDALYVVGGVVHCAQHACGEWAGWVSVWVCGCVGVGG